MQTKGRFSLAGDILAAFHSQGQLGGKEAGQQKN